MNYCTIVPDIVRSFYMSTVETNKRLFIYYCIQLCTVPLACVVLALYPSTTMYSVHLAVFDGLVLALYHSTTLYI